ncbi:hypothetical protein NKI94_26305 [Mesorhizobium australicum]|uniref:hypothetical protein n=1 Tax=Mesorhizobium australicum TaxID=536018 RepID=UPI00333DD49A
MTIAHPAACPFAHKAQSVSAIPSGTQGSVHQKSKSGGLRHVVEVSPLLTHMRIASDVSSHSSGAFPSGGFDLHTWPGLWSGLFLARETYPISDRVPYGLSDRCRVKQMNVELFAAMAGLGSAAGRTIPVIAVPGVKLYCSQSFSKPFEAIINVDLSRCVGCSLPTPRQQRPVSQPASELHRAEPEDMHP